MQLVALVHVGLVAIVHHLDSVAGRKFSKLANSLMIKQKKTTPSTKIEMNEWMIKDKVSFVTNSISPWGLSRRGEGVCARRYRKMAAVHKCLVETVSGAEWEAFPP